MPPNQGDIRCKQITEAATERIASYSRRLRTCCPADIQRAGRWRGDRWKVSSCACPRRRGCRWRASHSHPAGAQGGGGRSSTRERGVGPAVQVLHVRPAATPLHLHTPLVRPALGGWNMQLLRVRAHPARSSTVVQDLGCRTGRLSDPFSRHCITYAGVRIKKSLLRFLLCLIVGVLREVAAVQLLRVATERT